jgi:putative spermidine/putrescine transport system ATP-binding protein/spermidine/putrescine transport system ATP-binding protein
MLDTPLGRLTGTVNGDLVQGAAAKIVIPAEAIDIAGPSESPARVHNTLPARLLRADLVGHINHLAMELPNGRAITLEAHAEKYARDGLAAGRELRLTWAPSQATVIPAA